MYTYNFLFVENPSNEDSTINITVFAEDDDRAWQKVSYKLEKKIEYLKSFNPTVKKAPAKSDAIMLTESSARAIREKIESDHDDDIFGTLAKAADKIADTVSNNWGDIQKGKLKIEEKSLDIDRWIIKAFIVAFFLAFVAGFILIYLKNYEPVSRYIVPFITAIMGLIGGYLAGSGRGGRTKK